MQVIKTNTQKKSTPKIKLGTVVQWSSQAGGNECSKQGKVVAVLRPNVNYALGFGLPQSFILPLIQHSRKCSREQAKLYATDSRSLHFALISKYNLKFDTYCGMGRDTTHYLIEVSRGDGVKPSLYHPSPYTEFTVVK
jgi:hypothetical protein